MFGFLDPRQQIPEWRRGYARVCQVQRHLLGLTSLPFLSYEATFLYQLAIDLQIAPPLNEENPVCCRLKRLDRSVVVQDTTAVFAAAFGMMLAGVKLQDDVHDTGRWFNRLLYWKYRRRIRKTTTLLASFAPELPNAVAMAVAQHTQLEQTNRRVPIEEYSSPTSQGFAAAFAGICDAAPGEKNSEVREQLSNLGSFAGRAVIAWDCAVDFERDRITGEFNPLQDEGDVQGSFEFCLMQLAQMGWELPLDSSSSQVIASVARRVRARNAAKLVADCHRRLERWGLGREKGFEYARCDACCEIGACCDCAGAGAEAGPGCAECGCHSTWCCGDACCDCCVHRGNRNHTSQKKKNSSTTGAGSDVITLNRPYAEHEGSVCTTSGALNPSGYVLIDERRIPAKSWTGQFIADGSAVKIVNSDGFGLIVVAGE